MILPVWADVYDYANRAEWLGIGVWPNPHSAPHWTADELGSAFWRVLGDGEEALSIRKKAVELGNLFKDNPGRVIAAGEITKLARAGRP
jgi:hypothetical protein